MRQVLNAVMAATTAGDVDNIESDKIWIAYIANMDRISWGSEKANLS